MDNKDRLVLKDILLEQNYNKLMYLVHLFLNYTWNLNLWNSFNKNNTLQDFFRIYIKELMLNKVIMIICRKIIYL